jgi:hypothetical protein
MHKGSLSLLLIAALAATACRGGSADPAAAPAPVAAPAPAPPPVVAAGRWGIVLEAQGQAIELVIELRHLSEGEYAGTASSQMFPTATLSKATLTGNRLILQVPAPTGDTATFDLLIDGDVISGDWSMPGMGSKVSGRRIP